MSDVNKYQSMQRRLGRTRSKLKGNSERPRLAVRVSNQHITAQVVNDVNGTTLVAADSKKLKSTNRSEASRAVGKEIAELAIKAKVDKVVFDRGSKKYHGRVRQVAEAAREAGLEL